MAALGLFAHHPALARAFMTLNGHVLWDTTLTARQRQLLILRVVTRRRCTYMWKEHSRSSIHAGLTAAEVERVRADPHASSWDPLDAALLRAVDELIDDGVIAAPTWDVLAAQLEVQQLADVVATVGCYETSALLFRTFGLEASD